MSGGSPGSPGNAGTEQPAHFALDADSEAEIARLVTKYPPGKQASAVIPALYVAQNQMKRQTGSAWLPVKAMDAVAHRLDLAPIRVYEVATFYFMFNTRPIGKFHLQVCTTTPCWLRGSDEVTATCRSLTGITEWGGTSEDGLFTMTEVECLGACVNAPILQVDEDFYEDMDTGRVKSLIEALRRGERPPFGSMSGRQTSAPEGGPNTLDTLQFAPEA